LIGPVEHTPCPNGFFIVFRFHAVAKSIIFLESCEI
jgi:hypothetical protein